jgi:hypothetical protein
MSLTITINTPAPATLTVGVGTPGATGPAGPAGQGVPAGGTAGQFLTKIDGTNYNTDWTTVNLSAYAPLASPAFTGDPTAPTATFGDNDTSISTTAFVQAALAGGTAVAKNLEVYVRNQSGSTIAAGSIVYISGATGNRPLITLAQANNDANSAQTIGFVKTSIANNGFGNVIVRGELENIDTSALTEGAQLYLSPTTAGTWTTTKPSAPQHLVYVGIVLRSHPTLGVILVAVQNGYELGEIHDVALSSPANNDLLTYESSTDLWKNKSFSTLGLLTSADAATTYYPLTGNPSGFLTSASLSGYAQLSGATFTGEVVTPASTTGTAGLTITPGVAPTSPVNGEIWNTGSDLQVRLGGVTETLAEQSWVTSQGYITSSALTPYAPTSSPALTGNVTITTNSASPALVITQDGTGDVVQFKDVTSDTTYSFIDQNGKVNTIASTTSNAGFAIGQGAAPTAPVDGDVWLTTGGLFWRQNGGTKQAFVLSDTQTVSGSITFSNASLTLGNSTAASTYNIGTGATLTATTKAINIGTNGVSGSTTNIAIGTTTGTNAITINGPTTLAGTLTASGATITVGNTTAASTVNIATGATLTATTKAVNIGTAGVAGSTTNIAIGTTAGGTSTTTLNGTTNGVTVAADTNSVALATTAFVVGQAGSATPVVDGTAAVGTSLRYARQDHVHPTDTSRAALASPTFTGTPAAPTAAVDTNTTQLATTAYVVGQGYAKLASPTFTGTPTLPTGTIATTQTAGDNTTKVATTAFVTAAVPGFATTAEIASPSSTTKVVAPNDVVRMLVNRATFDTQNSSPTFATSGAGATAYKATNDRVLDIGTPNVGVAGYGQMIYDTTAGTWGVLGAKRGDTYTTQDWSKRIWMSGTHTFIAMGDANTTAYCMLGGRSSITTGAPTKQSIGWKLTGGGTALKLVTYGYNGASLVVTETTSSFTPVINQSFDWMIVHAPNPANAATSYCYLYVNDALVATGINAPADATINNNYFYHSFESTVTAATRQDAIIFPVKVWWSRS